MNIKIDFKTSLIIINNYNPMNSKMISFAQYLYYYTLKETTRIMTNTINQK